MLSLHTNAASLSTQNSLGRTQSALSTSQARLGTGFRVNSAMDDAAGLQIATRMDAQNRGMQVAMRNTQNAISMLQTAEGSFDEVNSMLLRMKDLATQAADATSGAMDQGAMQAEFDQLGEQLNNIMTNTKYNGQLLLDATGGTLATSLDFQIGADSGDVMSIDFSTNLGALDTALGNVSSNYGTPGTPGTEIGDTTATSATARSTTANAMIDTINTAIDSVGTIRAQLGGAANRLDHTYNNLSNVSTNLTQARGRIMDVDYATETSNMTAKQMLMQAGTSMLKQSNSMSQMVMGLMQ